MHAHNLRSPLAVGLVAAVAAGAIALPPTAGHLGLPGLRVVSGANIGLANCAGGADSDYGKGLAEWCLNNPDGSFDPATLTITGLARGNTLTVTVNDSTNSFTFTGPRGSTYGPYSLSAFHGAETFIEDLLQFSPGQRLENFQAIEAKLAAAKENLESAIEARVAAAKETLEKIAAAGLVIVVAVAFVAETVLAVLGLLPNGDVAEADPAAAVSAGVSAAKAPAVEAKTEAAPAAEAAPEATRADEDAEAPAVEALTAQDPAVETVEAAVDVTQPAPSSPSRRAPRAVKRSNSAMVESATRPHTAAAKSAANRRAPQTTEPPS
jgi:hypothetical protein